MKKTILYVEDANDYFGKTLLDGFILESKAHSWWKTLSFPCLGEVTNTTAELCAKVDGFVTRGASPELKKLIENYKKPHIILRSPTSIDTKWPLHVDDVKIGQIAYNETERLNLPHQAFLGYENVIWSKERFIAFSQEKNHTKSLHLATHENLTTDGLNKLISWLKSLPKPTSLFAASDGLASSAIKACMIANIKVPDEIAIIGADNDPHLCDSSVPTLSSIDLHPDSIGASCAWTLAKELNIISSTKNAPIVTPPSLVIRESSHQANSNFQLYRKALSWINRNALYGPSIQELADICNTSKRSLERAFLEVGNITPANYIRKQRIQGILYLLSRDEISLAELARQANFSDNSSFSNFVKRNTGKTPRELRTQTRK